MAQAQILEALDKLSDDEMYDLIGVVVDQGFIELAEELARKYHSVGFPMDEVPKA